MPIGNNRTRNSGQRDRNNGSSSNRSNRAPTNMRRHSGDQKSHANAKQKYERYLALARDNATSGDTIEAENFAQHAEHYFRVMNEQAGQSPSA